MNDIASLSEIRSQWTIDDLADANAIIDYREEAMFKEQESIKKLTERR